MDELVGSCVHCAHDVYCTAGFLNGILLDNKKILCFNCKDLLIEAELVGGERWIIFGKHIRFPICRSVRINQVDK
ncbi:hypothetical protein EI200_23485 [Peribacillus simplex]|uniref:hypothetical protein n=1 Tax=Peribacillus simplex TaxID=1478 RepID=UPI000F639E63|nr:hypothetical protein [Peribacillus simplex]RRN67202.1 hypothetical protein EI200_23485 [Peribacillus simplex]